MENEIVNVYLFYLLFFQDKNKTKGEHFITSTWWWMFFNCSFWFVFHLVCTEGYCISIIQNILRKQKVSFPTVPIIRLLVKLNQTFPYLSRAIIIIIFPFFCRKNQVTKDCERCFNVVYPVYIVPFDMAKTIKSSFEWIRWVLEACNVALVTFEQFVNHNHLIWQRTTEKKSWWWK